MHLDWPVDLSMGNWELSTPAEFSSENYKHAIQNETAIMMIIAFFLGVMC